jgi:hypothetical protein
MYLPTQILVASTGLVTIQYTWYIHIPKGRRNCGEGGSFPPHKSRVRQAESITKHNGRSAEKNGFQILFQKRIISLIN